MSFLAKVPMITQHLEIVEDSLVKKPLETADKLDVATIFDEYETSKENSESLDSDARFMKEIAALSPVKDVASKRCETKKTLNEDLIWKDLGNNKAFDRTFDDSSDPAGELIISSPLTQKYYFYEQQQKLKKVKKQNNLKTKVPLKKDEAIVLVHGSKDNIVTGTHINTPECTKVKHRKRSINDCTLNPVKKRKLNTPDEKI